MIQFQEIYTVLSVSKLCDVGCLHQIFAYPGTLMCFKDRNGISKTVNCISCSMVCKIVFCSKFPDILDNAGKVTRRRSSVSRKRNNKISLILAVIRPKRKYIIYGKGDNFFHFKSYVKKIFSVNGKITA